MSADINGQRTNETVSEAEKREVRDELGTALRNAGTTLPSLGIDNVPLAARMPKPLIEWGRCNLETARRITAALDSAGRPSPRSQG